MAVVIGTSSKGKPTAIYQHLEYVKEHDNHWGIVMALPEVSKYGVRISLDYLRHSYC